MHVHASPGCLLSIVCCLSTCDVTGLILTTCLMCGGTRTRHKTYWLYMRSLRVRDCIDEM